jgi:hypothetical protein
MHTLISSAVTFAQARLALAVVALWIVLVAPFARASEFCALTLDIRSSEGAPITSTWIELVDPAGKVEIRREIEGSVARICDFDFGPHVLRVGTNECLPVSISNLRVITGSPLHLSVVLNTCAYRDVMRNGCLLYIRAVDEAGQPVPEPEISFGTGPPALSKADSYGRLQTLFRGSEELVVIKDGFNPTRIRASCRNTEEIDIKAVMHKSKVQ